MTEQMQQESSEEKHNRINEDFIERLIQASEKMSDKGYETGELVECPNFSRCKRCSKDCIFNKENIC